MKKTKLLKLISIVLCLVLAISVIPAFADESSTRANALAGSTITANDFTWYLDDGDLDASSILLLAAASAKDGDGAIIPTRDIKISTAQIDTINDSREDGVFDVLLTVPDGTTKTIKITIYAAPEYPRLTAKSFSYDLANGDLTVEKIIELSQAVSYNYKGTVLPASDIVINASDVKRVNNKSNLGENPVGLISDSTWKMKSITVTTTYGNETDSKVTITGSDFNYVKNENEPLTDAKAKELASVAAKNQFNEDIDLKYVSTKSAELKAINEATKSGEYPLTFSSTSSNSSLTVKVNVTVPVELSLIGSDFSYDYNKESPLTAQLAKDLSKIIGKDQYGNTIDSDGITVNEADLAKINSGTAGKYDLTFTATATGSTLTLKVTVIIPTIKINASNFTYTYDTAAPDPLTAAMARELSFISAVDQDNKTIDPQSITVDEAQIKTINEGKEGTFPLTFTASNNKATASATVNVKVELKNAAPNLTISAKDFAFPRVKGHDDKLTAEKAIQAAEAKLTDPDGKEHEGLAVDEDSLNAINAATEDGTFDLTFYYSGDQRVPSVTVKVSVVFTEDPVDPKPTLTATDFTFTKAKGSDIVLTEEDAINRANIKAFDADGKEYDVTVTADADQLKAINSASESGVFDLTFTNKDDDTMTATVKVTLTLTNEDVKNATIIFEDIDGTTLSKATIAIGSTPKDSDFPTPPEVEGKIFKAWKIVQPQVDAGKEFNTTTIVAENMTIRASYNDADVPPVDDPKYKVDATDFTYNRKTDGASLTADKAKELAKLSITDIETGKVEDNSQATVDVTQLAAINAGKDGDKLPLKFSIDEKSYKEVTVTISDESIDPPVDPNYYEISATDFTYDRSTDGASLTADKAKELAKLTILFKDGNEPDADSPTVDQITVDATQLAAINAGKDGDKLPLKFCFDVQSKEVTVTIRDESIDPPVDKESIDASPFTYNTANGKLTETEAKRLANVKATDSDGKAIDIDQIMVDPSEFNTIANASTGTYDLTFSAGKESSITIKVTLTNEVEGKSTIRAYNFTYDLANGNLTATRAKAYASVSAKNASNKKIALSKITVNANELSAINTAKAGEKKDLTFTTPDGTSKTIVVTVKDTSKTANNWLAMIIQFLSNMFGGNIFG